MIQVRRLHNVRQLDTVGMLKLLEMGGETGGRDIRLLFTTFIGICLLLFIFDFFHFLLC